MDLLSLNALNLDGVNNSRLSQGRITPRDLSDSQYDGVSYYLGEHGCESPKTMSFKPDGTELYIFDESFSNGLRQFSLSTAWDITTMSLTAQVRMPQGSSGFEISVEGDKVYFTTFGATSGVMEYALDTPRDITSITTDNFYVGSQDITPKGLAFKTDGTIMYVVGQSNDTVFQYTLSTAWNINTATYANKSFSLASQDITPYGIYFKSDGSKMYVVGDTGNDISQYTLGTPRDVSTAVFDTVSFSVATEDITPRGLYFKGDGTEMYVVGDTGNTIEQYTLSGARDISTASIENTLAVGTEDTLPTGVFLSSDGLKMFVSGRVGSDINQYTLSVAWDISSATADGVVLVVPWGTSPEEIFFNTDGTKIFFINSGDYVCQVDLGSARDLSTATLSFFYNPTAQTGASPREIIFKSDGTKAYICSTGGVFYQYSLSTPWDITSATYDSKSFDTSNENGGYGTGEFSPDGSKLFIAGYEMGAAPAFNDAIVEYVLSTPRDISTASYGGVFLDLSEQDAYISGLALKSDGLKFYVTGQSDETGAEEYGKLYQYTL